MKDCQRLDVVSANLRKDPKQTCKLNKIKNSQNGIWEKLKSDMHSKAWIASGTSLSISEQINDCTLDVSISYEKKLRRYVRNIEIKYPMKETKIPNRLEEEIIDDLNSISSLINKITSSLSDNTSNNE